MAGLADILGLPAADPEPTGAEGAVAPGPVRQDRAPVVPQEQPAGPGLVPGGRPQGRPVAASGLLSASRDAAPSPDPEAVTLQDSAWTGQVLSLPPGALDALASGAGRPGYSPAEALWLLKSEALPAANPVLSGGLTIPAPEPGPARAGGAIAPGADLGLPDPADEGPALPVMSPAPLMAQPGLPAPQLPAALSSLPHLTAAIIDSLARRPDGVTEIALSPAELGQVRLTLQSDADNPARMVVLLSFDRPETMDLFRRHADQLAEALRAAGFTDTRISFGQHGADQTPFGQGGRDQRQDGRPDLKSRSPLLPEQLPDAWPGHPALRLSTSASLDLRL
ncbi:MAG: flagellar hook-length control protein FliK [Tabrizicola sp.]